ncbi:MAG TPA: FtsX-like permease family protein [Solirubrobacteraceae bacterium]
MTRLRNILLLYRVRLRARMVQELFAIVGIAIGVALLFSSQIASNSLGDSVSELIGGVVGKMQLQLVARSPQGFEQRLLGEVQRLPGVGAAMPVLEQRATVAGPRGQAAITLFSTGTRYAHLGGPLMRRFTAAQIEHQHAFALPLPLVRSIGLGSLQSTELQIGSRRQQAFVGAVLLEDEVGGLIDSPAGIAPLPYAQQLGGMQGRLTSILVQPVRGHEREVLAGLRRLARGRLDVQSTSYEGALFNQAAGPAKQSALLFSAISALVGFLFAIAAILFTTPQRRGLVEDLRLDGYPRRMIVEVLLFDALVLGVVASLLGLLLGDLLSLALFRASPGYLSFAFSLDSQRVVTVASAVLAAAGGLFASIVGVLVPLRKDILSPLLLQSGRRFSPRRRDHPPEVAGVLCLVTTTVILLRAPGEAILGVVSLVLGLLLLLPATIRLVVLVFEGLTRSRGSAASHLATVELKSDASRARSLAIAATGAIAVFGSVAIQGAHANLQRGLDASTHAVNSFAGMWVSPSGPGNLLATTPFPDRFKGALARMPGVRSVQIYRGGLLDFGRRRVWVLAPASSVARPVPASEIVSGVDVLANARLRAGGWIAISQAIAREHHLRVGQEFLLPSPRPTRLRIAALITNIGWPPGAFIVNAGDYAHAWGSTDVSAYGLTLKPGVPTWRIPAELRRALGPKSALVAETAAQRERRGHLTSRQGLARLTQISSLVLSAAVLAMAAAMGAMIWQRRRRLADMKVDGFGRGILWRSLLIESALLLGGGCLSGALFGLYGQLLLTRALTLVTGFPVAHTIGALTAIGNLGLVTAVALVILAVPGYLAACVRPAIMLQD